MTHPQAMITQSQTPQLGGVGQTTTGVPGTGLQGPSITFGMASRRQTGPLDVGFPDGADKHLLGWDADGHAINSLHLSTNTLWIGDAIGGQDNGAGEIVYPCCEGGDAPMEFNCWKEPDEGIYPVPVRLGYDPDSQHSWCDGPKPGLYRWWAMCNFYVANSQGQSQQGAGSTRAGSPCNTQGQSGPAVRPRTVGDPTESFVATVVQTASPVTLGRPNIIRSGFADLRSHLSPDRASLLAQDLYTPITYRMEAYGAQGGACGGSVLGDNSDYTGQWIDVKGNWNYTELPGQGRFDGGTTSGGVVLMPPEVDMADIDEGLAPDGRDRSSTFMIAAPGARFGAGLPNLANGGLDKGYTWFVEDGKLVFNRHDGVCAGLGVGVFELDTNGDLVALDDWDILAKKAADDTAGFEIAIAGGEGGDAFAGGGGRGGDILLTGGKGGDGTGALQAGLGGDLRIVAGSEGVNNGGGSSFPGNVIIGDTQTDSVQLGAAGVDVTIQSTRIRAGGSTEIGIQVTNASLTIGSLGSLVVPVKTDAGAPSDAQGGNLDGGLVVNSNEDALYFRSGGSWIKLV